MIPESDTSMYCPSSVPPAVSRANNPTIAAKAPPKPARNEACLAGSSQRFPVGVAGTEAHAAERVDLQVVTGVFAVVASASVGRDRNGNKTGMQTA